MDNIADLASAGLDDLATLNFAPPKEEALIVPFSDAEMAINSMVGVPDAPSPALRSRMNPEGKAAREQMGVAENFVGQAKSGTMIGSMIEAGQLQAVQTKGASQNNRAFTEAQLRQLPTSVRNRIAEQEANTPQSVRDERLAKAMDGVFEQAAYDLSQSNITPASVTGAIAANVLAPENLIALPASAARSVGQFISTRLPSASPAIHRALLAGVEGAFGNVITDPVVQAARTVSGGQSEYDWTQTALAAPVGFAAGASLRGAADLALGGKAADVATPSTAPDASMKTQAPQTEAPRSVEPPLSPREMPAGDVPVARDGAIPQPATVEAKTASAYPEPSVAANINEPMRAAALKAAPDQALPSASPPAPRPLPPPPKENYRTNLADYSDTLHREIDPDMLGAWLPNGRLSTDFGDVYFSHTPSLALGQAANRGVRIEVDAKAFEGQINRSKPAWEAAWQNGEAEFIAKNVRDGKGTRGALSAVEAPETLSRKGASGSAIAAQKALDDLVSNFGWAKVSVGNGRVRYERPITAIQSEAQPMARGVANASPDAVFDRQVLQGEVTKPRTIPANATPEEVASFKITQAIDDLAARLGRKVEIDGRFTARGAAGEYKLKDGVIRLREMGDFETFAHESGHAIDADLRRTMPDDWRNLVKANEKELRALDANTTDPAKKTADEGVAEFLRAYVTNPAYAKNQMAPIFADAFERMIAEKNPKLTQWIADARRVAEIDSGMAPTDRMAGMVTSQIDPGKWGEFRKTWKKEGLPIAFRDVFDEFTTKVIGKDQPVYRFVREIQDAIYEKTGKPVAKDFTWDDPYKRFRSLPGAEQGALRALWDGVPKYGAMGEHSGVSLHDAIKMAIGRVDKITDPNDADAKAFNGYLIARRAAVLYERFNAGDLRNRPIRATQREVAQSIADFEAKYPNFRTAADKVFSFAKSYLERKRDAGIITSEMFDAVVSKTPTGEYVPFYRDMTDLKSGGSTSRDGSLERGGAGQKIGGSTRDILDPLQSMMIDAIRAERLIARNDFVKSLHRLAEQGGELGGRFVERVPNSELKAQSVDLAEAFRSKAREIGLEKADAEIMIREMEEMIGDDLSATMFRAAEITPKGERILFYWDGGERTAIKLGNDRYSRQMFDIVSEMGHAERDLFLNTLGTANAYFTQFITNAPQFALKNLVMDNLSRVFVGRNTGILGRIPGASIAQGIYTSIFDREFAKAYEALGGMRGGVAAQSVRELTPTSGFAGVAMKPRSMQELGQEFVRDQGSWGYVISEVVKSPITAVKALVKAIEGTETIGRVGQAKIVYNHLKKQGLTDAEAMNGALFEARDILDYDRFGTSTTGLRRLMPFTNVAFQGTSTANQRLLTDPARAVAQWNARGRDWSKVDEPLKQAFTDGLLNWGMIAAAVAATAGYHATFSDSEVYQKASPYMKRRYWLIPLPGRDENGEQNYLSIPKPFDLPGAVISAHEAAMDGIKRADPKTYDNVYKALKDGFVPRQFDDLNAFISSQPQFKIASEVATGKTIPFEGGKPRDIVPQHLRGLPPEQQYTGRTSWLAKQIGERMGVSPMKVDHAMIGLTATAGRDVNDALTAAFDNNPNMTTQDAWTKMFFGGLYRRQRGVGEPGNALNEAMGQDGGKYVTAANGYRKFVETGDKVNAEKTYNAGDELSKTIMTFRGHNFAPAERQLHPLERAEAVAAIVGSFSRDLASSRVQVQDRSRKRGEEREFITVTPETARALTTAINAMSAEDILSGLKIAGVPGYQNAKVIDSRERVNFIKALSPEVGAELEERMKKAHIQPISKIEQSWPEVKKRLLQDRETARFNDLLPGVKLPKRRN